MRQIKKEIFYKLTKQILMSVYWAMYYLAEVEEKNKQQKKSKKKSKTKIEKLTIKKKTLEKKKNTINDK